MIIIIRRILLLPMSKSFVSPTSHPYSRYSQQWKKIITQQWEEVWQMTADRVGEAPNLIVKSLNK
jgi:hypothetical protein